MKSITQMVLMFFVAGVMIFSTLPVSFSLSPPEAAHTIDNVIKTTDHNQNDSLKILFIGSSNFDNYNYYNLPSLFEDLAIASGRQVYIDSRCIGGWSLYRHATSTLTESKINEQDWDYVVLQGSAHRMAYPDYFTDHPVNSALVALRDKISANCACTQMILGMPWAFEDGMTWYENWTDTYEDMQIKIFENTLDYAQDIGFAVAPVGWAWYAVLKEKNYPLHYLHTRDWVHPTLKGSYLMASVIFSTVFLEPSTDIAYYGGLSEGEAKYFQSVASDTFFNNFNLWNIVDDVSPAIVMDKPREFLYIADRELIPLSTNISVILGKITIAATAEDYQSGINRIELFVDGVLVQTTTDGSFTMVYDDRVLGSYNLTMVTYDNANNTANLQHPIWIFNI